MAGKIDEQGVYPAILDIGKNDNTTDGASSHSQQNASRGARSKDEGVPNLIPTGGSAYQSPFGSSGNVFHSSGDLFDPSKSLMNSRSSIDASSLLSTPRTSIDVSSLMGTPRPSIDGPLLGTPRSSIDSASSQARTLMEHAKLNAAQQESSKMMSSQSQQQQQSTAITPTTAASNNTTPSGATPATSNNFAYDERFHLLYEREIRWTEVRRYSEFIRRFATELSHLDLTKENFYDLYNMALCLLKSVDGLDPDKIARKMEQPQQYYMQSQMQGQPNGMMGHMPQSQSVSDLEMQRKNFEYAMANRPNAFDGSAFMSPIPKYGIPTSGDPNAVYAYNQAADGSVPVGTYALPIGATPSAFGSSSYLKANDPMKPKNFTGEVFFDDINQGDDRRPKRRRRRTVYSSRRNLHCHMCGVTETPEWRRGPAGDHTLCNACGLHYAKSLKKQRKERDARKHSIDMLLNENQQALTPAGENSNTPNSPANSPPSTTSTTSATTSVIPVTSTPIPAPVPPTSVPAPTAAEAM